MWFYELTINFLDVIPGGKDYSRNKNVLEHDVGLPLSKPSLRVPSRRRWLRGQVAGVHGLGHAILGLNLSKCETEMVKRSDILWPKCAEGSEFVHSTFHSKNVPLFLVIDYALEIALTNIISGH